ncbi:MAG: CHAT domain-containing protein [Ardenticatenaceae bacterium]
MQYLNFDLLVDKWGEQYKARVLDSPVGQASCILDPPFTSKEVNPFLVDRRVQKMGFKAAKQLGSHLFRALLADDVGTCWHSSYQLAGEKGVGLRLRLRLGDVPELAALPWEYLYIPTQNRFVSLSAETPIVRYLELPQKVSPLNVQAPLHILVMMANPLDCRPLNGNQEWKKVQQALSPLEQKGLVRLSRLRPGTLGALQRQLRKEKSHIFHFIGHGAFDTRTEEGGVLLEDNKGMSCFVSGQQLGRVLRDHRSLRLVLLNACDSARASHRDPFGGTAQRLVQQGIPAVIAMQFQIEDKGAIALASEFYAALADGYPVDAALSEGRKSLAQEDSLAWGIPVLYMRSSDGQLFEIRENLERAILSALYERFESDPSSAKMTFTELYQAIKVLLHDKKQLSAVNYQLFSLQRKGWIQHQSVADDRKGLVEITPEGIQVAEDRRQLMTSASELASSEVQQDDEREKSDADRGEPPPATLADLIQREPNCARILQRQALMQEVVNSFEQKVNRSHFIVLYCQDTIERTKILHRLSEMLDSKYAPLMLMGLGIKVRTSHLDAFLFDLATQLARSFDQWRNRHELSILEPPRWDEFNQRGVAAFETYWERLQQIADPRPPVLIIDRIEELLDFSETLDSRILRFLDYFITIPDHGCFIFSGSEGMLFSQNEKFTELIANAKYVPVKHYDDEAVLTIFSSLQKYLTYEKQVLQHCLALCDGHPRILPVLIESMLSFISESPRTKRVERKEFERIINMTIDKIRQILSAWRGRLSKQERFAIQLISHRIPNPIAPSEIHLDDLVALAARHFPSANVDYNFIRRGVVKLARREWVEWTDLNYNLFRFKLGIFLLWLRRDHIMFEEVMP